VVYFAWLFFVPGGNMVRMFTLIKRRVGMRRWGKFETDILAHKLGIPVYTHKPQKILVLEGEFTKEKIASVLHFDEGYDVTVSPESELPFTIPPPPKP
jgi:hypothetical protein